MKIPKNAKRWQDVRAGDKLILDATTEEDDCGVAQCAQRCKVCGFNDDPSRDNDPQYAPHEGECVIVCIIKEDCEDELDDGLREFAIDDQEYYYIWEPQQ